MTTPLTIELLYFDGCPGYEEILPALERLTGQGDVELVKRTIDDMEEAVSARFLGSPSVRVEGVDVEPGASARSDFGMKCRVYRVDGQQTNRPHLEWISLALERARTVDPPGTVDGDD